VEPQDYSKYSRMVLKEVVLQAFKTVFGVVKDLASRELLVNRCMEWPNSFCIVFVPYQSLIILPLYSNSNFEV